MSTRWVGGALLAAAAAGPLFSAPLLLTAGYWQNGLAGLAGALLAIAAVAVIAVPIGFLITALPSFAGAAMMAALGRRGPAMRHPAMWAVAGLCVGWAVGVILLVGDEAEAGVAALLGDTWPFGIAGIPCALLARWRTRWKEMPA